MEDQPLHIIGEIHEGTLGLGTSEADGANEEPHVRLLLSEDMFDEHADL